MATSTQQAAARVCRIKPKYFLGVATKVKGNVQFVDDNTLIYPIGRVLLFHNLQTNEQRYMKIPQKPKEVTRIAMAPNRKLIAVVEKGAKCTISVFNVETRHRVVILGNPMPHCDAEPFEVVSFTCDSEHVVALSSGIDAMMFYYNVTGRVESVATAIGATAPVTATVTAVACHPADPTILCLVGHHMFRFISWTDGQWVQYGFDSAGKISITTVCWITEEMVLVGTRCGRLMAIEYADVKGVYSANTVNEIHIVKNERMSHVPKGYKNGTFQITAMISFASGFIYSFSRAAVVVFEQTDHHTWVRRNIINTVEPSKIFSKYKRSEMDEVMSLAVSPSGNKMSCTTGRNEVYVDDIFMEQDLKNDELRLCTKVLSGLHAGRVANIAICRWKPLVMSIGKDEGFVRIWNYKTKKLVVGQTFPEEKLYGCAIHPTGWFCLIGFKHQLKLFMVTVDEFKSLRLFRVKMCNLVEFSRQGHLFAASNHTRRTVEVYCGVALELLWTLKCYNLPITGIHFGSKDQILFATDPCGSVNCWDMQTGEDVNHTIYLDTPNYAVTTTRSGSIYFVGADGCLRKITSNHQQLRAYRIDDQPLQTVAIGEAEECLFVAGNKSSIFSVEFPLTEPLLVIEFKMHSWPIRKILVADNDTMLISLDEAGIIGFWKIKVPKEKHPPKIDNWPELQHVVINVTKLSEEDIIIEKQRVKIERKMYQHNYILQHVKEMKEKNLENMTSDYLNQIEELKKVMKTNEKCHSSQISRLQQKFERLTRFYTGELEKQSKEFEADLMQEYSRSEDLKGRIIVNVWDVRRFVKTAKAATKQIFEMYDTFMNMKIHEIKQETVELRYKKKCLLQKFDRETYNFEKFVNDCIDQYKTGRTFAEDGCSCCPKYTDVIKSAVKLLWANPGNTIEFNYHDRRLQKLQKRREYLRDEILFLVKKRTNMEDKMSKFSVSGTGIFGYLDDIRRDTRILKTKNKALEMTLAAVEEHAKKKDDLIFKINKAVKSDVHEQMEKNERLINLKFVFKPFMEAEMKAIREKQEKLHDEMVSVKSRIVSSGLCIATLQKQIDEVLEEKGRQKTSDKKLKKYLEEVKTDMNDTNAVADNRVVVKKALMHLYKKYINPHATVQSAKEFCDERGMPNYTNLKALKTEDDERTGLEDVVEAYEYDGMLRKGEDRLRTEIETMRKAIPKRPRLVVNRKFGTHAFTRGTIIMKEINNYRYLVAQALELLTSEYRGDGCPCEETGPV